VHRTVWGRALSWRRRTSFMFRLAQTIRMRYGSFFEISVYRLWFAPKSRQGILNSGIQQRLIQRWQRCSKLGRLCGKIAS
jgi:hypothetical protein